MKEGMKTFKLGFPQTVHISSRRPDAKKRLQHFVLETLENIVRGSHSSDDERSAAIEIIKERTDYCTHLSVIFVTPAPSGGRSRRAVCKFCELAFSRYLRVGKAITYVPFYSKEAVSHELTLEGVKPLDLGQKS
jgi:hypothetical protein